MNYYYCFLSNKVIELKNRKSHFESELHMKNEKTVINKYTIMNPELCQINNIIKNNVNNYNRKFIFYEIVCNWKLVFYNDISIDVKSKVLYRFSI